MEKYNLLEADIERLYRFAEDNKDAYANAEPFLIQQ